MTLFSSRLVTVCLEVPCSRFGCIVLLEMSSNQGNTKAKSETMRKKREKAMTLNILCTTLEDVNL